MRSHVILAVIIITIWASTCYAFEPGTAGNFGCMESISNSRDSFISDVLGEPKIWTPSTGEDNFPHVWSNPEPLDSEAPCPFSHSAGTSDVPNNSNKSIITTDTFSLCGGAGGSSTPNGLNTSGGLGLSGLFQFHPSGSTDSVPLCPFANGITSSSFSHNW